MIISRKTIYSAIALILFISLGLFAALRSNTNNLKRNADVKKTNKLEAMVMANTDDKVYLQDSDNIIYTFSKEDIDANIGSLLQVEYTGELDRNKDLQDNNIVGYSESEDVVDKNGIPNSWMDNGIFSKYYILANKRLKKMSLDEKIGQLLLVRYPDNDDLAIKAIKDYKLGGYLFFERDFKDKTAKDVVKRSSKLQKISDIPLLMAVDEEGGRVVRISSNPNLVDEPFKSSRELYQSGGFELIKKDTINKSEILKNLGLNLNLAPVVDVSTDPDDYMYYRSLGEDTDKTSTYAKTVIEASKDSGVSYTLKHFPGYGNNDDTHDSSSTDNRSYNDILNNDIPPFKAGIKAGAEAVLVSHNIVNDIDPDNPASLSPSIHNLLRNELAFTGIIMTDDIAMGALSGIDNTTVKAIAAGNDIIITTDYKKSFNEIKTAVNNGTLDENLINKLAFRVLAWKYYKGLLIDIK